MDRDGIVEIEISEDAMTVTATFMPPLGEGRLLDPDFVDTLLESRDVIAGIDYDAIGEAILAANTDHRMQENVVVARGVEPVAYRPAFYRIVAETGETKPTWSETDRVDHKEVSRLPVIHAGDVIAEHIPEREGVPGTNVRGEEIPFPTEAVESLQPGKNTRVMGESVIAEIGGQLQIRDGAFHVEDRLEISGTVGFGTGSIEFPGDVVLKGEVKDGFHVWAGKSIIASTTVDVSEIYCRGDFTSTAGVIGRGKALLRCGGKVQARFASMCFIESKSSVYLDQYAYQSRIGCQDRLAMGKNGRIVGGLVTAINGVRAHVLGNQANVPTVIRVGIDFIAERKLRLITEKHQAVTLRLQRLTEAAGENPSDRQLDILHKLEESRNKLAMQMGEVAGALDANEAAEVVCDSTVHPGVEVFVCRSRYVVEQELSNVRFVLEKETGRVIHRSLKEDSED